MAAPARLRTHNRRIVGVLTVALPALVMVPVLLWPTAARGASPTAPLDPRRIFAQSEPATVLILGDFKAQVVVPTAQLNSDALKAELNSEVSSGALASDQNTLLQRALQLLATNPDAYLLAGDPPRQSAAEFQVTGSGFIIDSTGYVVTNAHVAAPHDDEIKQQLAQIGLQQLVTADVKDIQASLAASGVTVPDALVTQLGQADAAWLAKHLTIQSLTKDFSAVLGANIPGVTTTLNLVPGAVVTAGDPIPGRDVAILKLEQKNLPTLHLGDDSTLRPGDKLYVLGYPGAATFHPLISKESITEPSFTAGTLSARKQSTGGFEVLQTDAAVTHGNSGGPVLDEQGDVIGIATFGSISQDNTELAGFNFIMPATLIKEFVDRSGAHPAQSEFTTLYDKGLDQEAAGKNKAALATFTSLNLLAPGHPYVQQHISADEALVASGHGGSSGSSSAPLIFGIVVLLLLVAGGVIFMRRRGNRPVPAMASGGRVVEPEPTMMMPPPTALPEAQTPVTTPPADMTTTAARSFCGSCGAPLEGKRFCGSCGTPAS